MKLEPKQKKKNKKKKKKETNLTHFCRMSLVVGRKIGGGEGKANQ